MRRDNLSQLDVKNAANLASQVAAFKYPKFTDYFYWTSCLNQTRVVLTTSGYKIQNVA